eukprot:Clim_evm8s246 gene=Clim_evmTU8s246
MGSQPHHSYLSGMAAGLSQVVVGYPLDTVKVRMQMGDGSVKMTTALKSILVKEGPLGFYKGMLSPMVGSLVFNSILFGTFDQLCKILANQETGHVGGSGFVIAALGTGVVESVVYCPTELLKVRLQTAAAANMQTNLISVVRDVYQQGGLRGFYRGFLGTILRESPGNVVYFGSYEFCKEILDEHGVNYSTPLIAGGMAGTVYWTTQFPFDTIKTHMQGNLDTKDLSTTEVSKRIYSQYGFRGFFKGLTPCLIRAFPANAVAFGAFELSKEALIHFGV